MIQVHAIHYSWVVQDAVLAIVIRLPISLEKLILLLFQVIQFPIADCALLLDCTSCLGSGIPPCGWCVLERKCSRRSECQNSEDSARWIQAAARANTDQCPTITVSPEQYVVDNPQNVIHTQQPCVYLHNIYFQHNNIIISIPIRLY